MGSALLFGVLGSLLLKMCQNEGEVGSCEQNQFIEINNFDKVHASDISKTLDDSARKREQNLPQTMQ